VRDDAGYQSFNIAVADRLNALEDGIADVRQRIVHHELWKNMRTEKDVQVFMEAHVFAVWDFMSILKTLQRGLTCTSPVWYPSRRPRITRFINEIVVDEEADVVDGFFAPISHAELYLEAMRQCGASTTAISAFMTTLRHGGHPDSALESPSIPPPSQRFVRATQQMLAQDSLPAAAACFAYGREKVIPSMFHEIVGALNTANTEQQSSQFSVLLKYLERHIEVDGDEHGPLAREMVGLVCGVDDENWRQAEKEARGAMVARVALWDGILEEILRVRDSDVQPWAVESKGSVTRYYLSMQMDSERQAKQ